MTKINTKAYKDGDIFGRVNDDGSVDVFEANGARATRLDGAWPVESDFSGSYEHPEGIVITQVEAWRIGLFIDD